MSQKNTITLVIASDNHYAVHIAALLKSIDLNHTSGEHIDLYIIDDGISPTSRKKIERIVEPGRVTIKWVLSKDVIPADIVLPLEKSRFPLTAYLRLFAPYIIDKSLDKLLYLDVDIIVQDDISKLWNMPLGDSIIGAVQDSCKTVDSPWSGISNYRDFGLAPDTKYFNSGVLLINPKKWRDENISIEILSVLNANVEHIKMADQYGFNVVFANKWLELDPNWNWFAFAENPKPSLVHFIDIKPIYQSYKSLEVYRNEFYRYLSLTPWKSFKPISHNRRNMRIIYNRISKAFKKLKFPFGNK
jgi:lipopolysaccharide biosynthesis glycosyltransferase